MKKSLTLISFFLFSVLSTLAQSPAMDLYVKDIYGFNRPYKDFIDSGKSNVTLFVFWKTCCHTNLSMVDSLIEVSDESEFTDRIKIVLVAVDDVKTSNRVLPVVRTKGWTYDVIVDVNMELARAMQVYIPPQ